MKILPFLLAFPLSLFGGVSGTPYSPPAGGGSGSATNVSLSAGTAITIGTNSSSDWSVSVKTKGITTNLLDDTAYGLLMQTGTGCTNWTDAGGASLTGISNVTATGTVSAAAFVGPTLGNNIVLWSGAFGQPYASVDEACAVWQSGDVLKLSAGTYIVTNAWRLPIGGGIVGEGRAASVIVGTFTNGVPTPTFSFTDNSFIYRCTISNLYYLNTNGYQAAVGIHGSSYGLTNGYTNAVVRDVILYGASDTYYARGTNHIYQVNFEDCDLFGEWDIVALFNLAGATPAALYASDFTRCRFFHNAQVTHPNYSDVIVTGDNRATARLAFKDCEFSISNAPSVTVQVYFLNNTDSTATITNSAYDFENCTFTNHSAAVTGSGTVKIMMGDGYQAQLRMVNCIGLNWSLLTDMDSDVVPVVERGTLNATRFGFGGSSIGLNPTFSMGTGEPSANEPAGSIYVRSDGGTNTTLYIRVGSTWTAK